MPGMKKENVVILAKSLGKRLGTEKDKVFKYAFQHKVRFAFEVTMILAMLVILVSNNDRRVIMEEMLRARELSFLTHYSEIYRGVSVTCYNPTVEQCDKNPTINASGEHVRYGDIAVSRDLIKKIPFGSMVLVKGKPYYVADTMGEYATHKDSNGKIVRILQRNRMDILKTDYNEASEWGCQKLDVVVIPRGKDMFVSGFDKKVKGVKNNAKRKL
jgi:3D (Asp-Asp-Asp) domain-containing protein